MRAIPFRTFALSFVRSTVSLAFVVLTLASCCYSADIVLVRIPGKDSAELEQLHTAIRFYGLHLIVINANSAGASAGITRAATRRDTVGVVIEAHALGAVNRRALSRALRDSGKENVPILIAGVTQQLDPALLHTWTGGAVSRCAHLGTSHNPQYVFGRVEGLTGQLAGLRIPLPSYDALYLIPGLQDHSRHVLSIQEDTQVHPVFIRTTADNLTLFVACAENMPIPPVPGIVRAFLYTASSFLFVKYCAGNRGWHTPHHYGNLTIDDPWLRQPYGYLNYTGLLAEMQKHNFHTTIAFIPWNYSRSEPVVVSLFRHHPDRFSIAIHGDNHVHKEFTDYHSVPLATQITDLKQSLARMHRFRMLTRLPYDKVMIFPHSIAPEETLAALKKYNYLATVNSHDVPQGSRPPHGLLFALRPFTVRFADFLSITRYSIDARIPKSFIAINGFLDNPLLFYGHSEDFAGGIGAFDHIADTVNTLVPDTRWRSVGDIVRHLYLVRLREDSNYDVQAFSSDVCLENSSGRDAVYHVRKEETAGREIESVTVNDRPQAYQLENGYLALKVPLATGQSSCVSIRYKNDLNLASLPIAHRSFTAYLLRMGSDFRDIYLARVPGGVAFIHFYDEYNLTPGELFALALVFLLLCVYAWYRLKISIKRRRLAARPSGTQSRVTHSGAAR